MNASLDEASFEERGADVPLEKAMLVWINRQPGAGAMVVAHPDRDDAGGDFIRSAGACTSDWRDMTEGERLGNLLAWAWQAVVRDKVDLIAMHNALVVIPEFRAAMTPDMLPEHYCDEWFGE